ncbi:prolyl oligopeptidase family serine peptidase [Flavobacterium humidisoli]|uniref:Prolyl oligopeptidase family serine peptidase n=1 Tax=Flavobacterium humidisoli TaxID=2937442 RepID=A0ABY4LY45_9FLAO|nr:prolyl oligopeptidase family serine peptidase [Flavobacterium humidisoli]UPZ18019.1 prolyl oligopeptidase family serine peptidase [Flavobacterium humidisoli]
MITYYYKNFFHNVLQQTLTDAGFFFILFILPLVACPLWGQERQKENLHPKDYDRWGRLLLEKVSPDERWVSYKMIYQNTSDTLFVKGIEKNKIYSFTGAKKTAFTAGGFICLTDGNLHLLNLAEDKSEIIHSVKQFGYLKSSDIIIVLKSEAEKKQTLLIRTLEGRLIESISNVISFSVSPDENKVVYTEAASEKKVLMLMDFKRNYKKKTVYESTSSFTNFTWSKNGKAFAFNSRPKGELKCSLHYCLADLNNLYTISSDGLAFDQEAFITDQQVRNLSIADDGSRVFFNYKSVENEPSSSGVELWNGNDKLVYLEKKVKGDFKTAAKTAVWNPFSNKVFPLTSSELPKLIMSADQKHALLYNPEAYEPQWEMDSPIDFFLIDTHSGEKKKLIEKQSAELGTTVVSPSGKYVAYFKGKNWWIYNIKADTHTDITKNINSSFSGKVEQLVHESVYRIAGWSLQDKEILIYDEFDIWAVKCDGSSYRRLTKGREKKIKFSMPELLNFPLLRYADNVPVTYNYDIQKELLLKAEGYDGMTGWFKWNPSSGEEEVIYKNRFTDQLYYNLKNQKLIFTEQDYNVSPRIVLRSKEGSESLIFQSNPQQLDFLWGHSQMIYYKNTKGRELRGVLIFPADYNAEKKYPMIVHVYEELHGRIHKYVNPSLLNSTGFNHTVASLEGYFVFLPDVIAEQGNPGRAITDCITTAIAKVIEKNAINPKRIGLIGHSFGGYESSYLITQTDLFAAAVSGNGISDLGTMSLSVSRSSGKPDMWRFEKDIWMLGKTLMEAPKLYQINSAIYNADKVKTPLLLWVGQEDRQVDMRQSIEYYLALRRLGKKTIMLQYPEEDHVLFNKQNQMDLSRRIMQWFNYYLKDDFSAEWIKNGTE